MSPPPSPLSSPAAFKTAALRWLIHAWPGLVASAFVGSLSGGITARIVAGGHESAKPAVVAPSVAKEVHPDEVRAAAKTPIKKSARTASRMDECLAAERQCINVCGDLGFHCRNGCGSTSECKAQCDPQEEQCKRHCEATRARCINP